MSVTLTNLDEGVTVDGKHAIQVDVAFGTLYPTGGEPIAPSRLGLLQVDQVLVDASARTEAQAGAAIIADVSDPLEPKLLAIEDGAEATNESNQTGVVARVRFVGT